MLWTEMKLIGMLNDALDTRGFLRDTPRKHEGAICFRVLSLSVLLNKEICEFEAKRGLRGRPLMVWGGRRKIRRIYFFLAIVSPNFSWRRPFHIYFFLEEALLISFSWRRVCKMFFSQFPPPPPRSLMAVPLSLYGAICPTVASQDLLTP